MPCLSYEIKINVKSEMIRFEIFNGSPLKKTLLWNNEKP